MFLGAQTKFDTHTKQQAKLVVLAYVVWDEEPGFKCRNIRGSFKMFKESFYFREISNITILYATQSSCATI